MEQDGRDEIAISNLVKKVLLSENDIPDRVKAKIVELLLKGTDKVGRLIFNSEQEVLDFYQQDMYHIQV